MEKNEQQFVQIRTKEEKHYNLSNVDKETILEVAMAVSDFAGIEFDDTDKQNLIEYVKNHC